MLLVHQIKNYSKNLVPNLPSPQKKFKNFANLTPISLDIQPLWLTPSITRHQPVVLVVMDHGLFVLGWPYYASIPSWRSFRRPIPYTMSSFMLACIKGSSPMPWRWISLYYFIPNCWEGVALHLFGKNHPISIYLWPLSPVLRIFHQITN